MNFRLVRGQMIAGSIIGTLVYVLMEHILSQVSYNDIGLRAKLMNNTIFGKRLLQSSYPIIVNNTANPEVRHIAFVKVHRTGSATLKQIFLKFGHIRNLTFVLPNLRYTHTRGVISEVESLTNKNILPPPKSQPYDILCHHVIYNRNSFKAIFPKDTVYIGAVRDPISRFQSAIYFFEPTYILQLQGLKPLSTYSRNPLLYEPTDPRNSMTNNRMAVDFGFPIHIFPDHLSNASVNEINEYIKQLDTDFQLIIVNELFDESLVLMKKLLNWGIRDILYLRKHVTFTTSRRNTLSETDILNIKDFLYLDYALYNFAVNRIKRQIREEGDTFKKEVAFFKNVNTMFEDYCSDLMQQVSPRYFPETDLNREFEFSHIDCLLLKMKLLNSEK